MDNKAALILGSSSPFRRELLERLQIPFTTCSPDVDETPLKGESPKDLSLRLSVLKAQAVAAQHPHCVVIGCDQVLELNGRPVGNPAISKTPSSSSPRCPVRPLHSILP